MPINGFLKDSVLLPCNCSGRNLSRVVKWQMEGLNGLSRVLELDVGNTSDSFDRYKGRAKIFVANCSLLLTNITAEDQGKYTCRFYVQELYMYSVRKLNISGKSFIYSFFISTISDHSFTHESTADFFLISAAKYNVCQQPARNLDGDVRVMVFQCDATGRYGEAEIQWYLDGELLSNSSKTNITHTSPVGTPTGHYKFKTTLFTQFEWTAEPICGMKVKGIPSHIEYVCEEGTGNYLFLLLLFWRGMDSHIVYCYHPIKSITIAVVKISRDYTTTCHETHSKAKYFSGCLKPFKLFCHLSSCLCTFCFYRLFYQPTTKMLHEIL